MGLLPRSKADFLAALNQFHKDTGIDVRETNILTAAKMCKLTMEFTPPLVKGGGHGLTKFAKQSGNNSVARDIKSLFVAKNDTKAAAIGVMLNQLKKAAQDNDQGKFKRIKDQSALKNVTLERTVVGKVLQDGDEERAFKKAKNLFNKSTQARALKEQEVVTDLKAVHEKHRYFSNQGKTKVMRAQGGYLGKFVVNSKGVLEQYIKLRQLQVGRLKAGWFAVLSSLPRANARRSNFKSSDIPTWIKRHPGNGYFTIADKPDQTSIVFGNAIGDNDGMATKANVQGYVYAAAIPSLMADAKQFVERSVRRFNGS